MDEKMLNELVERIAEKHYRHPLTTRGQDRLDFHEVSCWAMREALEAAVRAGYDAAKQS
jgi:hypothetical protein